MDVSAPSEPEGRTRVESRADDGRLLSVAHFGPDGALDGEFVAYAADGAPQIRMLYRAGLPDGPAVILRDGRPLTEMAYAAGKLDGPMRGYDPAGRLTSVVRYEAGRKHGLTECFSVEGALLLTAEYHDDRRHGVTLEYRPGGNVRRRAAYVNDLLDGETIDFHPSGRPAERTLFKAGIAVEGPQSFADPDGPGRTSLLARLRGK